MTPHQVSPENAPKMLDWLRNRGGLAIWRSINLSNPGASWTTPLNDEHGQTKGKPTWQADNQPERVITDPKDVVVITGVEVKRFHVAIRATGPFGATLKCTDASSRKVHAALDKANQRFSPESKDCWYEFDYETQEAVIYRPGELVPLDQWEKAHA